MRIVAIAFLLICAVTSVRAQSWADSLMMFRHSYKEDLIKNKVLGPGDTSYVKFYPPDQAFRVVATFTPAIGAAPFLARTHGPKMKAMKDYGTLSFTIHDTACTLHVYQMVNLIDGNASELFIPFTDVTSYETTFGGGRYMDITAGELRKGTCTLDFNRCYNPYCAYADGYSCPIPPIENNLMVAITVGELFYEFH
jgi:uncharacterized protein